VDHREPAGPNRQVWFEVGNKLRTEDPAYLVRACLREGEIVVGLRNVDEVSVARELGLVDLFAWLDHDAPEDPTMTFGHELCDVIVANYGPIDELHEKKRAFARFARLMK